jgi:hypothetical protein
MSLLSYGVSLSLDKALLSLVEAALVSGLKRFLLNFILSMELSFTALKLLVTVKAGWLSFYKEDEIGLTII